MTGYRNWVLVWAGHRLCLQTANLFLLPIVPCLLKQDPHNIALHETLRALEKEEGGIGPGSHRLLPVNGLPYKARTWFA